MRALAALTMLLALAGCPNTTAHTPTACTKFGDKCVTEKGPLGVCENAPCGEGQTPPCLKCTPQH